MANVRRISGCILVLLLSVVLGFMIGQSIVYFMKEGAFVSWKPFLAPTKFERIIQASSTKVWVQGNGDSIYEGNTLCQEGGDCQRWQVVTQVPVDLPKPEWPIKRSSDCKFNEFSFMKTPPGEPVECVQAYFGMADTSTTVYYALLKDGSIAIWLNSSSNIEALLIPFFSTVTISIVTAIFGVIYWFVKADGSAVGKTKAG